MRTHRISRSLVAAMVAVSVAGSGSAWADRKNDQRSHSQGDHQDKRAYGRGQGGHQDKRAYGHGKGGNGNKNYAYNKHHKNKRHYYNDRYRYNKHRGYGYGGYGTRYYDYDDDDNDDDLWIGLLVGGLLGYAINDAQQEDPYRYESYTSPPAQRGSQTTIYEADRRSDVTCLQEREYQTKVIVGGRTVDAYGSACLQPDGSWSRSPAELASY